MLVSLGFQTLAVAIAVIVSILTVDTLGAIALPQPLPPLPRISKAMKIVASSQEPRPSRASLRIFKPFAAPTRIPVGVAKIDDGQEVAIAQAPTIGFGTGPGLGGPGEGVPGALDVIRSAPVTPPPPKTSVSQPAKPIQIGGNVLEAKLVNRVMPIYPPLARQARVSGTVRLEGIISREGRVVNLQVISGHPLLINAAVDAVRRWAYRPTLLNGQPVEVIAPIDVHFTLAP